MAKSVKQKAQQSKAVAARQESISKMGFDVKKLDKAKPRMLSDAQRAKLLGTKAGAVKLPLMLTPRKPVSGKSSLTIYTTGMVYPKFPADSGQALFNSQIQWPVFPGAQVEFPRVKTGKMHLVEFNVQLNMNVAYKFRVFTYPLAEFQDITIQGPKVTTLVALVPPVDEITGNLELGASIQNRNTKADNAGWALYSVRVSTTE